MATLCSYCGQELPRDDVRFCNNCGAMRITRPTNPPSFAGAANNPSSGGMPSENAQPAPQAVPGPSPLRIKQRSDSEQSPTWLQNLQREPRNEQASKDEWQPLSTSHEPEEKPEEAAARKEPQVYPLPQAPEPATHTTVIERPTQADDAATLDQLDFPVLPSTPQPLSPVLRVKVWNETQHSNPGLKEYAPQQEGTELASPEISHAPEAHVQERHAVEDQPTRLMESMPQSSQGGISQGGILQGGISQGGIPVDAIPTSPLHTVPGEQLQPAPGQNRRDQFQPPPEQIQNSVTDVSHIRTVHLPAQPQSQMFPPSPTPAKSDPSVVPTTSRPAFTMRGKKRLPLIIGSLSVLLLLILASGSWVILVQPFRVSPVTDPQQSFTNAKLGISLRYPGGWKQPQVDYGKQMITLRDGSDTAQVNITIANAAAEAPESHVQKQAAQLGLNNIKPGGAATFAGVSWQSIQGDAQVSGAEYTYGLFTTLNRNHIYTLTQLAPRSIYTDEERLVFAPTRLSFHFI